MTRTGVLARHLLGDMVALYRTRDGQVDLVLHPAGLEPVEPPAGAVEGLVQLHLRGDALSGRYLGGRSMRAGGTRLRLVSHETDVDGTEVTTTFTTDRGLRVRHVLRHVGDVLVSRVRLHHEGVEPVTVDLVSSFALAGISPYADGDGATRLVLHRWRSSWSMEGRLVSDPVERLHLEPDWACHAATVERFGQVGTMPTRGWFPQVVVEDTAAGVCWGAQVAWAGSWQLEAYRHGDDLCLAGGLADRELGHWTTTLDPGGRLDTPEAVLTVVAGTLDDVCDRLVDAMATATLTQPEPEQRLPVVVNEWCTTWGRPTHDGVVALADWLVAHDIRPGYLVIDAGWYRRDDDADWSTSHGDWRPSPTAFPYGLRATADAVRQRGIVPGIWFEAETVGRDADAYHETAHLLSRDGSPLTVGGRRFWDLTDPWVATYLDERVVARLRDGGFGYLKLDYNEHLGLGPDHHHSFGEGLRQQVLGTYRFLDTLRARLPDLVIESCASGGHRLEPSLVGRTAMSSFSDAHEAPEIPLIAAALHRLLPPRQSQVWAVLHPTDRPERLRSTLAAAFLGRMCLSGELTALSAEQAAVVRDAVALYGRAAPEIAEGTTRILGPEQRSWRHPRGWQAVRRLSDLDANVLVVAHTFADAPAEIEVPLGSSGWQVTASLHGEVAVTGDRLRLPGLTDHDARVVLLHR